MSLGTLGKSLTSLCLDFRLLFLTYLTEEVRGVFVPRGTEPSRDPGAGSERAWPGWTCAEDNQSPGLWGSDQRNK